MTRYLFAIAALSLSLAACDSGSSKKDDSTHVTATTRNFTTAPYRFIANGCDTGEHNFDGNSAEDLKNQLCTALQDDDLNGGCARDLRKQLFDNKCHGLTWTPTHKTSDDSDHTGIFFGHQNEPEVRRALRYVLVNAYQVAPSLADDLKAKMIKFAEDTMSCGVGLLGQKCLDSANESGSYDGTLTKIGAKWIFYAEIRLKGFLKPVGFRYAVDSLKPLKVPTLDIVSVIQGRQGQLLNDYLNDPSNFTPLLSLTLDADFNTAAWTHLDQPRDLRELYHLIEALLPKADEAAKSKLAGLFVKNMNLVTQSGDVLYQNVILTSLVDELQLPPQTIADLAEGLLVSNDANLKEIASSLVLQNQPKRTELKIAVLQGLSSQDRDTRLYAIDALGATKLSVSEQNQILLKIADSNADVRAEAVKVSAKFIIGPEHLATVKTLMADSNSLVRLEAARLLGRMKSAEATQILIQKMDDADGQVHSTVFAMLKSKALTAENVPELTKLYASTNWLVRNDVSTLLGDVLDPSASSALIAHMNDANQEVRRTIIGLLFRRHLTNASVPDLTLRLNDADFGVRKDAAKLLGRIGSDSARQALTDRLAIETNDDVKLQIQNSLKGSGRS